MKEENKRKDRIKTITIIFLVIMLILTLFSNTIMGFLCFFESSNLV